MLRAPVEIERVKPGVKRLFWYSNEGKGLIVAIEIARVQTRCIVSYNSTIEDHITFLILNKAKLIIPLFIFLAYL